LAGKEEKEGTPLFFSLDEGKKRLGALLLMKRKKDPAHFPPEKFSSFLLLNRGGKHLLSRPLPSPLFFSFTGWEE